MTSQQLVEIYLMEIAIRIAYIEQIHEVNETETLKAARTLVKLLRNKK